MKQSGPALACVRFRKSVAGLLRYVIAAAIGLLSVAAGAGAPTVSAQSGQSPVLARDRILITGGGLQISPEYQAVPRNTATIVDTHIAQPGTDSTNGGTTGTNGSNGDALALPADALVFAELRGPAFGTPVTLTTRPGEPFAIQPLALSGLYYLENIRLVSGGQTLLVGNPDTATLEVIDRVLNSQVTSRALSAQEILDRGIVVDQTNFQVVNFTAAFGLQDRRVPIDFPMIVPTRRGDTLPPAAPAIALPTLQPGATPIPTVRLPELQEAFQTTNVSVSGLLLQIDDSDVDARGFDIPPIPGVIIIPGNIAYLNQFFSVLLMVSNVAPGNSQLVVRDVTAEIVLPAGNDTVAGSGDDPLRMALLGNPPVPQSRTQLVRQPGPDGKIGTPDDILTLAPQQSGEGEYLVEGRREGTHTVEMKISAVLDGLPIGPVKISGRAVGVVEVRNPTFALTLSHPQTISAGEEYDFLVIVTNTSETPANFVSLNLLPRSISGATLLSDETVSIETIAAGDSETVVFRLLSQQTGTVTATSIASEGVPGKFELRTAVGALGIPMSPNTLVLSSAAAALPAALRSAGTGFLGQAFALATSPVTPKGLLPITQQIVYERATDLSEAGQRLQMQDTLPAVARDLAFDWTGGDFTTIADRLDPPQPARQRQTEQDFRGFDELLRQSKRGDAFLQLLGGIFGGEVQTHGVLGFHDAWAEAAASRPAHISAITGAGSGAAPVVLSVLDPGARRLGLTEAGGTVERRIPFSAFFDLLVAAPSFSQMALLSVPEAGSYTVTATGTATGTFDLGLVVPEGTQLRRLTYQGVPTQAGSKASVTFTLGGTNAYVLQIDETGDGTVDRQVVATLSEIQEDRGPVVVSAVQIVTGQPDLSQFGQLIGLLFSEEISKASSQDHVDPPLITNYAVEANQVLGVALQPSGRVVLLSLRDGYGPFVSRSVTVTGIVDRRGNPIDPAPTVRPIIPHEDLRQGGTVSGQVKRGDGTPVPGARIRFSQKAPVAVSQGALAGIGDMASEREVTVTVKDADGNGRYAFEYVRIFNVAGAFSRFEAIDLQNGEKGEVITQIRSSGQHLDLDIVLLGTGTLAGQVFAANGTTPLAGAVVQVSSLTRFGDLFSAVTNSSGAFAIAGVPVGNVTIEAAHVATNSKTLLASAIPAAGATVVRNLTLIPLGEIQIQRGTVKGQIFRADGVTPVAGVPVFTDLGGVATTTASGSYRIEGLPAVPITVKAIDQARREQGSVVTTVVGGQEITANILLLGGTGTVRGVVLDSNGTPVANAVVGGGLALVRTDVNGAFTLAEVPLGQRTISALDETRQLPGSAAVNLTVAGEDVPVQIVLQVQGTVAGRIFEANGTTPVAGLKVFILGGRNLSAVTDSNGAYRFEHLPAGPYTVSAFRPDFSDGNIAPTKLVFRDEVRRADVVFRGKGRVTGVVLDDDGVTPLGGRVGLSELQVRQGTLKPPENAQCLGDVQVGDITLELPKCEAVGLGFITTDLTRVVDNDVSSGTFVFENVFVGPFTVRAANAFSPVVITAHETIPAAGETVHVKLQLVPTSVVTGTVYRPDGVTPVGADVVVTFDSSTISNVKVVTDLQGRFLLPLVNPGGFSLTAEDAIGSGLVGQIRGSVEPGQTADIKVRLLGKGTVTVTVSGSNGPISGARVTLRGANFPFDERQGFTGTTGTVTFAGGDAVTEGAFSVTAFDGTSGVTGSGSGTVSAPGAHATPAIVLLDEAGTVRGRFLKADETTAIRNAQVRLSSSRGDVYATTDQNGAYVFEGVAKGVVTLEAFDPVTARRGRNTGQVNVHLDDVTVNVVEIPQGTVKGIVRLSTDSSALAGADVSISVSSIFGGQFRTSSGTDGRFAVPGISKGTFSVTARDPLTGFSGSASRELTTEGEEVEVVIDLQVPAVGRVEGVVLRSDGTPALGARVVLNGGLQTTVDNEGFYFFPTVAKGAVSLLGLAQIGPDAAVGSGDVAFAGDVERVDLRLVGTGTVTGTVRKAGVVTPFARVVVTSRSAIGRSQIVETQTSLEGRFEIAVMLVGDVSATAVETGTLLAGSGSGKIAAPGAPLDLQIALEPAGSLTGRVLRENGSPAAGMALELTNGSRRFGSTGLDGMFQFPDLSLGTYRLNVSDPTGDGLASAGAELVSQGQVVPLGDLTLDEAAPGVVSIAPANGTSLVPVTQAIEIHFSEPVDPATVTASSVVVASALGVVAGNLTLNAERTRAVFAAASPYRDFSQVTVKVTTGVKDRVGRALSAQVVSSYSTADSTPPAFLTTSPGAGGRDVMPEAVVRVAYSEAIDPARFGGAAIVLTVGGAAVSGRIDFILSNTSVVFTPTAPLSANASYQVTVRAASDVYGNAQSQGLSYSFSTLDTVPPPIQQITPSAATVFEGSSVTISANMGAATDVAAVEFLVNGQVVLTDRAAPYALTLPVTASLGASFTVSARATDLSGNTGQAQSVTIAVQPDAPPAVSILAPADGTVVNTGSAVNLRVRGTDDRGVSRIAFQASGQVTAAGAFNVNPPVVSQEATFTIQIPGSTPPGSLLIRVASTDVAGASSPTGSIAMTVTDATQPTVQVVSPVLGTGVDAGQTATILVSAADNGTVASISLDATGPTVFSATRAVIPASTVAQASFDIPIPASVSEGQSLNITVRARDAAGNDSASTSRSFAVIIPDTTSPVLSGVVTASGSSRVLAGDLASLRASVADNVGVTSLVFETQGALQTTGSVSVTPPVGSGVVPFTISIPSTVANGATITVTVKARDAAGNLSQERSILLTVGDTAAPVLTILSPAAGAQFAPGQSVLLRVQATDDTAIRSVVFGASGVFASSSTQLVSPPAASAELTFAVVLPTGTPAGTLVLTGEALDGAGNSSGVVSRTVAVTDVVAPVVRITAPAPGTEVDPRIPVLVTIEVTDAVGVTQVTFTASGAASSSETRTIVPVATTRTESFTVNFAAPPAAGGTLVLGATARDEAGNVGQASGVTVLVRDVVAPTVLATQPADGAISVDPQAVVVVQFSEPMDPATLSAANLTLSRSGVPEPVIVSVSSDGRIATLTPEIRPLALNTTFVVTVATAATDSAANAITGTRTFSFRTVAPDTTAPRVQTTTPSNGAVGVPLAAPIDVTFTEGVDPLTVTPQSFRVRIGGAAAAGTLTLLDGNARARFTPSAAFPTEAVVVVELTNGIADAAGNALRAANGDPLTTPFTLTFVTAAFGITSPAAGVDVVEKSTLLLEARATGSAGVTSVVFTINGQALPPVTSAPFATTMTVPPAAGQTTLTIQASGRNAQGVEIASDSRTVTIVVGLRVTPSFAGVPQGGTRTIRFSITSPLPEALSIQLRAGDPLIVTFPVNPVIIPAGQTSVDAALSGQARGNTAVFGESSRGNVDAIISVGVVLAGTEVIATAPQPGVAIVNAPSAATIVTQPGETKTTRISVLTSPAPVAIDVSVVSTNPSVATGSSGPLVAGRSTIDLTITSGQPGVATLVIRVGDQVRGVTVIVGSVAANALPLVVARPAGLSIANTLPTGHVLTVSGRQSTVTLNALPQPATAATPVTVDSTNPSVATATADPIQPGSQSVNLVISAHGDGTTLLIVRAGAEVRAITVIVGDIQVQRLPLVFARPAGVSLARLPDAGRIFAPTGAVRMIRVRLLDTPATADTPVTVTSTNPSVATLGASAVVRAGEQAADLMLSLSEAGSAMLTLTAGSAQSQLEIVVGSTPEPARSSLVGARPVGATVVAAPSVGRVIATPNVVSAPVLVIPLLRAPAAAPVPVAVSSSDPTVAAVGSATFSIEPGQQIIEVTLSISGAPGVSVVSFEFDGQRRELLVIVGNPPASQLPALLAPVVGVQIK